ncbi:MAG: terminase [Hafnia sp.]
MYYIKDKDGQKVLFTPNSAQEDYYTSSHQSDIILKARQLGFTTFKMVHDLDTCLFRKNFSAGCIAHSDKDAKDIYRNKIRFAYEAITPRFKAMLLRIGYGLPKPRNDKDNGYVFTNGSSIGVSTGYRGGTLQSLHVSEFGKICKKYPDKAQEIVTGAFNAVGKSGTITIESTAEGKSGYFYSYCMDAKKLLAQGREPAGMEFKFHFFPWWKDSEYSLPDGEISLRLAEYFGELEAKHGIALTDGQKRWYAAKEKTQGDGMKREYPSTPEESFAQAIEGAYYARQFSAIYAERRIGKMPNNDAQVNTAWDLGVGDSTAIWFWQEIGDRIHVIDYYENSGEGMRHYFKVLRDKAKANGWSYGTHYAPHDMSHKEFGGDAKSRAQIAREGLEIDGEIYSVDFLVLKIMGVDEGIELARGILPRCCFNEEKTADGVKCLESYRKEWDARLGCWKDHPLHDWASHGADAFRYLAMACNLRRNAHEFVINW